MGYVYSCELVYECERFRGVCALIETPGTAYTEPKQVSWGGVEGGGAVVGWWWGSEEEKRLLPL